jgi:hypothetical protein
MHISSFQNFLYYIYYKLCTLPSSTYHASSIMDVRHSRYQCHSIQHAQLCRGASGGW